MFLLIETDIMKKCKKNEPVNTPSEQPVNRASEHEKPHRIRVFTTLFTMFIEKWKKHW